ncbi:hypothetical protein ZWY2020_037144 [Hordeum vulgare]|nr:hypothetical protein ZWY2020_037144 [Hordeum vulgare]
MSTVAAVAAINDIFLKKRNNQKASSIGLTELTVSKRLKVAHFEFLITSEYKIPTNIFPRLPLWSTTMLKSFIALDTMPGMIHLSQILGKIITNSIPTMESYVDDAMSLFDSSITSVVTKIFAPLANPVLTPIYSIQENIMLGNQPDFQRILNSFQFLYFPGPHIDPPSFYPECSQATTDSIIENFSKFVLIDDSIKFDSLMTFGSTSTSGNSLYCAPHEAEMIPLQQNQIRVASPLNDPGLLKLMEDFEAECRRNELQVENKKKYEHFFNEVWVDQKTLTISFRLGCWMNPQSLDCFFNIMNPDASRKDKFTSIISIVCYNFKSLFAPIYPNCTAFSIKDFYYNFIVVPRIHFRLCSFKLYNATFSLNSAKFSNSHNSYANTCVLILQILKTYRGMGVLGFTTVDLQALSEIFLYEIAKYNNSEVQLPTVMTFLQNHGFRSFK